MLGDFLHKVLEFSFKSLIFNWIDLLLPYAQPKQTMNYEKIN